MNYVFHELIKLSRVINSDEKNCLVIRGSTDEMEHYVKLGVRTFYKRKVSYTLLVMIRKRFSLLQTIIEDITFGLVRMYVTPYRFSWTIFILGLALSYNRQIVVFQWVQIVLLL